MLVLAIGSAARADILMLDDGTQLQGKAHKDGDVWIVTDAAGHETTVAAATVTSIQIGGDETPEDRLATVRRMAGESSDLRRIIDRYDQFIKTYPDTPQAQQAQAELIDWKQKLAGGYVKIGSQWLSPRDRDGLAAREAIAAGGIVDLIRSGRPQEAQKALNIALTLDPDDPAALYLQSLLLAEANQNVAARADLEHLVKIMANHGPTYNNLAVVLWRQRLGPAAMKTYVLAMSSSPVNKAILDNVAEALHDLPPENRDSPPVVQAATIFAEQDALLQQSQQAQGLRRWGATWAPANEIDKLEGEEQSIQSQLADIQADEDKTQASIASDDAQILQTQQAINNGVFAVPQPPDYLQLQRDLALLTDARQVGEDHLKDLQADADKVEHSLSVPRYTGTLRLIGLEGVPIRAPTPATQP